MIMPKDPGFLDKVEYVVSFWSNPCHAPLSMYLEMSKEPAVDLFLDYIIPSPTDVAYNYFRPGQAMGPRGGGGGRRGKNGKSPSRHGGKKPGGGWHKVPGLGQDTGAWVGNNLPGAEDLNKRPISHGERTFWLVGDQVQRALFLLWLGDALSDFFYHWAMLMDNTEECRSQFRGGMHYEGGDFNYGGVIPCNAVFAPILHWKEGGCGYVGNIGFVPARPWQLVVAMECENIGLFPSNAQIHVNISDLNGSRNVTSQVATSDPGQEFGLVGSFSIRGPGNFSVICCATPSTLIKAKTVHVVAWGGGAAPIL